MTKNILLERIWEWMGGLREILSLKGLKSLYRILDHPKSVVWPVVLGNMVWNHYTGQVAARPAPLYLTVSCCGLGRACLHCKNHIVIKVLLSTWWNVQTKYLLAWTQKFCTKANFCVTVRVVANYLNDASRYIYLMESDVFLSVVLQHKIGKHWSFCKYRWSFHKKSKYLATHTHTHTYGGAIWPTHTCVPYVLLSTVFLHYWFFIGTEITPAWEPGYQHISLYVLP